MNARLLVGLALIGIAPYAFAQEQAMGAKMGNLGLAVEYAYRVNDWLAVRGSLGGSGYSFDDTKSSVDYNLDIDFDSLSVGVDFHPTKGALRLSLAAVRNDSRIIARSNPAQSFDIGGVTYPADEVGTLLAGTEFDGVAPYAGIGWDWRRDRKVGVTLELGLLRQDPPTVFMTATGPILDDPQFQSDLETERQELQDLVDDFDLYPVASLGFVIRF